MASNNRAGPSRRNLRRIEDEEDETFLALAAELILCQHDRKKIKIPQHDGSLSGRQWVEKLINGHYRRIMENMRITADNFLRLCNILVSNGYVSQSYQQRVEIEEALAMTLVMVSHHHTQRTLSERFNRSLETINRNIRKVLAGLCMFAGEVIKPYDQTSVHPRIANSRKFFPWFKGAVGAIDGTHIPCCPPSGHQMAYTNRHGDHSQNLLAVCDFDMRFNYIYAGWEGSAHDARVLEDAMTYPSDFPMPPPGKYYLVDAAYRNMPGFLPPYKNVREGVPAKRLFNTRHSQLRNVIERTFGVLKARFKFLKGPVPNFYMSTQISVVIACCTLHNFLRMTQPGDSHFQMFEDENVQFEEDLGHGEAAHVQPFNCSHAEIEAWKATREAIANQMYEAYGRRRR